MPNLFLWFLLFAGNDEEVVFRALDSGDAATLRRYEPAQLLKIVRSGRPVEAGRKGSFHESITDTFGRKSETYFRVPENYDRRRPAGVLIVLHGIESDGSEVVDLFSTFAAEHNLILVAPSARKEPPKALNEDVPVKAVADQFVHWWSYREGTFVFTALSLVKKRYAVDESRVFLSGYSMGGFGTWNIGLRFPDRFAALVPIAGGLSRQEYIKKNDDRSRPLLQNAYDLPIYFVHGSADPTVSVAFDRKSRDQLKQFGYDFVYQEIPKGSHLLDVSEKGPIMTAVEAWLKPKKRNSHPKEVRHYFIGEYCPQAYWVRVESFRTPTADVKAKIDGQTIEFASSGVAKISFYVDETLLDPAQPIRVRSGDRTLFEGQAVPSVETMLECWKAREDRDLTFRAKITVEVPE